MVCGTLRTSVRPPTHSTPCTRTNKLWKFVLYQPHVVQHLALLAEPEMARGGCVRLGLGDHVVHVHWEVVRLDAGHDRGGARRGVEMSALQDIAGCWAVGPRESRCHGRRSER